MIGSAGDHPRQISMQMLRWPSTQKDHSVLPQFPFSLLDRFVQTNMVITVTNENDKCEIDFLDCTFTRNNDGTVSSKWFKKDCCSLQTLNYHSSHNWSVKNNNAKQMAKFAFSISSPVSIQFTKSLLSKAHLLLCLSSKRIGIFEYKATFIRLN